jgi:transcription antitermination factor NusG
MKIGSKVEIISGTHKGMQGKIIAITNGNSKK